MFQRLLRLLTNDNSKMVADLIILFFIMIIGPQRLVSR